MVGSTEHEAGDRLHRQVNKVRCSAVMLGECTVLARFCALKPGSLAAVRHWDTTAPKKLASRCSNLARL